MKRFYVLLYLTLSFIPLHGQYESCYETSPDSNINIVVFIAVDCPISQKYIPVLNAIQERYKAQSVAIRSIIPGKIKKGDLQKFVREYDVGFPVVADKNYKCVKPLGAGTTPEVFVFDDQNSLKYRGAIDNWFYELGGYRKNSTEDYLIDAIESLLAGHDPEPDSTSALGCLIQVPK